MQITLPPRGKEGSANYREKKKYDFSVKQVKALSVEVFTDASDVSFVLGKQGTQVMNSLVNAGLFKAKRDGSYDRTKLGAEIAERLSERV